MMEEKTVRLFIAAPADRDTVLMILGRNGYTVRQGRAKENPGGQEPEGVCGGDLRWPQVRHGTR